MFDLLKNTYSFASFAVGRVQSAVAIHRVAVDTVSMLDTLRSLCVADVIDSHLGSSQRAGLIGAQCQIVAVRWRRDQLAATVK